ncbi:hypothetical protein LPJ75_005334, partial [Coemansia sp. RSA 2598]
SNFNSDINMNRSVYDLLSEREKEAEYIVRNDLEHNANVPLVARPRKRATASASRLAANHACAELEKFIAGSGDGQSACSRGGFELLIDLVRPLQATGNDDDNDKPRLAFKKESDMYPCIAALLQFINAAITNYCAKGGGNKTRLTKPARQLQVYKRYDVNPKQMDTDRKIDMALYLSKDGEQITDAEPDYEYIFAVIEAKLSSTDSEQHRAYKQLVAYSYDIYTRQINRRFAWGFTVCSS